MKDEYIIKGSWSTGINGNLIYIALAKEKMNPANILAIFTTEILFGARKKWGDGFLKNDTEVSTIEHFSHIIPKR